MKKTTAKKLLDNHYEAFYQNISITLNLKADIPNSIEFLKFYKSATIEHHLQNTNLNESQKKASKAFLKDSLDLMDNYSNIIYRMSLVYIVASFEVFLKESMKLLLKFDKKILANSDKKISYQDIFNFENYDELSDHIVNKLINELTYKNIVDQIMFLNREIHLNLSFKKKKGLTANRNFIDLECLKEIFSTRNILLHNNGKINKIYLENNPKANFKLGEERIIDKDYLLKSWAEIRHNGEAIRKQAKLYIKTK